MYVVFHDSIYDVNLIQQLFQSFKDGRGSVWVA